ncbi:hypothetical protein HQ524_04555 [Candidatus Uhrbacteria bacterium]|nr:hypothetical protein [Candidatus Uhrbacteria bacterium]
MKKIISFAGAVGSSKTPTSHYLSCNLGLPILNNDTIRTEVIEDLGEFDEEKYVKRRDERIRQAIAGNDVLIYDASVDREWGKFKSELVNNNVEFFIISFDLSKGLLGNLYNTKGYDDSLLRLDDLVAEHERFLSEYSEDVGVRIDDDAFADRMELVLVAVGGWLNSYNA